MNRAPKIARPVHPPLTWPRLAAEAWLLALAGIAAGALLRSGGADVSRAAVALVCIAFWLAGLGGRQ